MGASHDFFPFTESEAQLIKTSLYALAQHEPNTSTERFKELSRLSHRLTVDVCPSCGSTHAPNCFAECVCECHDRATTSVVVAGSLYEGINYVYGPFSTRTAAERWNEEAAWDDGVSGYVFSVQSLDIEDEPDRGTQTTP